MPDWLTPREILDPLGPFDLDPCAGSPRPWNCARHNFTAADDGLSREWFGRVWLNPPWGPAQDPWLERMAAHRRGIALVPARTETDRWHRLVWPHVLAVCFVRGRVRFHRPGAPITRTWPTAPTSVALLAYLGADARALHRSGLGQMVQPR